MWIAVKKSMKLKTLLESKDQLSYLKRNMLSWGCANLWFDEKSCQEWIDGEGLSLRYFPYKLNVVIDHPVKMYTGILR